MEHPSILNLYQCNNYENSEYISQVHSPFYGFPSEIMPNAHNYDNHEKNVEYTSNYIQLVSSNDKENVPENNQLYSQINSWYPNEITNFDTLECNSQKNTPTSQQFSLNQVENNFFSSQGQVLSPFLGFENDNTQCNQFSQPPALSPFPGPCNVPENNQLSYSQPPVLSPFLEVPNINPQTQVSYKEFPNQSVNSDTILKYQPFSQCSNNLIVIDENSTLEYNQSDVNLVPITESMRESKTFVLENNQNSLGSELVRETIRTVKESDNLEIISTPTLITTANNLDISENRIILQTPIKQVAENLNYDLILPLNPEKKDDKVSVLKYLNDSTQSDDQNVNCSMEILKTPVKNTSTDNFISPIKTVKKMKEQSNSVKKSISFHPSTSVISNTGEQTPSKYNASFSKGNNTSSDFSPEMFSDDGEGDDRSCEQKYVPSTEECIMSKVSSINTRSKQDRLLLRKLHESFVGILPPPSITICQFNADDILSRYNQNKDLFSVENICPNKDLECSKSNKKSMLINCDLRSAKDYSFPEITTRRYHGLHYNRSKISEDIEQLCQKYSERFVGCETASSCTIWQINVPSSASKRRMIRKQQTCKSPGRRLSHLARRRITFSRENLNAKSSVLPSISMSTNQRLIGVKKSDILMRKRLSPCKKVISPRKRMLISPRKRKTPNKRSPQKRIRTPSNSAKKCRILPSNDSTTVSNRTLSSKRALFQSPDTKSTSSNIKRKLFSGNDMPDETCSRKRKRELDDDLTPQREKFLRSFSSNDVAVDNVRSSTLNRRHSEMVTSNSGDFSEHHTKKMLWAISTALRTQNVGMSHPNFKTYASVLSQICKRLLSDLLPGQTRLPGSVNERMSKIAHQHVYAVVKGKTVDEIVEEVKSKSILLSQKPKGYIAPDIFDSECSTIEDTAMSSQNLVIKKNQMDKSRIRRQIIFDKLI